MITGGMSYREVVSRMNCAPSTSIRLVERHNVTGSVKDLERPGRQRLMSAREDRHTVLSHLRDRFRTATQTAQDLNGHNQQRISRQTVSRRLR